tara:strand:+ start:194 stop:775 length:582 start_codon:yes stop_codon:yes gene_type:complete
MADFDAIELNPDLGEMLDDIAARIPEDWMLESMLRQGEMLRGKIVRAIMSAAKEPKGDLMRSYQVELVDKSKEAVSVGVYSDLVYAEIQDEGGTVYPKKKWLAYPHKDAKSYVGVRWPRDFGKGQLHFALSKKSSDVAYLFEDGRAKPVFILRKSVDLPGLDYLNTALDQYDQEVEKDLDQHIGLSFEKAGFK